MRPSRRLGWRHAAARECRRRRRGRRARRTGRRRPAPGGGRRRRRRRGRRGASAAGCAPTSSTASGSTAASSCSTRPTRRRSGCSTSTPSSCGPSTRACAVARDGRRHVLGDPLRMPSTLPVRPDGAGRVGPGQGRVRELGRRTRPRVRRLDPGSGRTARCWTSCAHRGLDGALTDRVLRPFLSGVLADDELASSQRVASMLLRAFARGNPSVPAQGMQAIPDQLAARLASGALHLGVRAGRWRAATSTPTRDGSRRVPWSSRPTPSRPPSWARSRRRRCAR